MEKILVLSAVLLFSTMAVAILMAMIIVLKEHFKVEDVFMEIEWDTKYKIFTKEDYRWHLLSTPELQYFKPGEFDELWERMSKGGRFIIGGGYGSEIQFYSIEYFSENILGGK